jgi:hypothetical protein
VRCIAIRSVDADVEYDASTCKLLSLAVNHP